jgi:hypothetical protein
MEQHCCSAQRLTSGRLASPCSAFSAAAVAAAAAAAAAASTLLQLLLHQLAPLPAGSFTAALQKPLLDSSALLDGSAVQVGMFVVAIDHQVLMASLWWCAAVGQQCCAVAAAVLLLLLHQS